MKLLMLGASKAQLPGIVKGKELGCQVVVCDYLEDAIGHSYSDVSYKTSTFDLDGVLEVARKENVDGVMTLGTDQPVLTCAYVSEKLGLPTMLTYKNALDVTNKILMKKKFKEHNIPTVTYMLYEKGINDNELLEFDGPVVIKPVDSQGQRGIYFLENPMDAMDLYDEVISFSREKVMLVERYYEHTEVTVSGWVRDEEAIVLTITDRVTFAEKEQLGICLSHEFPSRHKADYGQEIIDLTHKIVEVFQLKNGPIYFQFLIGDEGIKVNEIACRIGGAYEATFMPLLTGFDILEVQLRKTLGLTVDLSPLDQVDVLNNDNYMSVQMFFLKPCTIHRMPDENEVSNLDGVVECGFNVHKGDLIQGIMNATSRGGYVVVMAKSKEKLKQYLDQLYELLVIEDEKGNNCIIHSEVGR